MRKVVILQEYVPAYRVPFFEQLIERSEHEGIDVVVAAGTASSSQAARGDASFLSSQIHVPQRERRVLGRRLVVRDVRRVVRDADLVILEQARRNIDAYRMLAWRTGALVALWGHGRDYTRRTSELDRAVSRWLMRRADWFFAYTPGGADAVVRGGFPENQVSVVQNTIDTSALRRDVESITTEEIAEFRRQNALTGQTALFIGALDEAKRLDFLIDASRRVRTVSPQFQLVIAGDGPLRTELASWVTTDPWVQITGPLKGRSKAIALAAADVLAMPGRVGLVAVDSFAGRTPIVTTAWPWHAPEFEYLNTANAVVTADDTESYATGLASVLADDTRLGRLQAECARSADAYTMDTMVDNFLSGIRQALTRTVAA